jgi:hypothetical protein
VSDSLGRFRRSDKSATGAHQKAEEGDKNNHPLPDELEYRVPFEVGKTLRNPVGNTVDPYGTSTLVSNEVASLVYMDVGRWSGSAPTEKDTESHWGKRRDFGIVHGRLAVLCSYTHEPPQGKDPYAVDKSIRFSSEFENVQPLLDKLSSNRDLGWVTVTKAALGRTLNNETPREDRIYVFLGDLHAPIMTKLKDTYADQSQPKSLTETGLAVQAIPGAYAGAALASGALKRAPMPGWRGRYDRGAIVRNVLPGVARTVGETAKHVLKAEPLTLYGEGAAADAVSPVPAVLAVGTAVSAVLVELADQTRLREWPDPDGGDPGALKDWFDRYHGANGKKGADIFEDAGTDLQRWLVLLKQYQIDNGTKLPVRLMQLGDLFDFWVGLKCPFSLPRGARIFPDGGKAAAFVTYWMEQSLLNPAINYLWHFDEKHPKARGDLKTVFLYGNHDTYMGSLLSEKERLNARFDEDPGLVAQHGHQEDAFNSERRAAFGYLLTQAAFADDYVRTIEDPVSSLGPTLFGGSWTRLGLAEMAINTCLFDGTGPKKKRAMIFVMGHTHEPMLQTIHVVSDPEDKENATSTTTSTSAVAAPASSLSSDSPRSVGQSRNTGTSTAPGNSQQPAELAGPSTATHASASTNTSTEPGTSSPPDMTSPANEPVTPPVPKESATSTATSTSAATSPASSVSSAPPQSVGQSHNAGTSTAPGSSPLPARLQGPSTATNASASKSTSTGPQPLSVPDGTSPAAPKVVSAPAEGPQPTSTKTK